MGVVNTLSALITKLDAFNVVDVLKMGGRLREQVDTLEVAAADDDTSVYRFLRVHSSWRMSDLVIFNDAITGGTDFDCGLYRTAEDGGAVVDADLFASGLDLSSASGAGGTAAFDESVSLEIADMAKPIWDLVSGLTEDPAIWYDVALTANTVGSGAGTITMRGRYVDGT